MAVAMLVFWRPHLTEHAFEAIHEARPANLFVRLIGRSLSSRQWCCFCRGDGCC